MFVNTLNLSSTHGLTTSSYVSQCEPLCQQNCVSSRSNSKPLLSLDAEEERSIVAKSICL